MFHEWALRKYPDLFQTGHDFERNSYKLAAAAVKAESNLSARDKRETSVPLEELMSTYSDQVPGGLDLAKIRAAQTVSSTNYYDFEAPIADPTLNAIRHAFDSKKGFGADQRFTSYFLFRRALSSDIILRLFLASAPAKEKERYYKLRKCELDPLGTRPVIARDNGSKEACCITEAPAVDSQLLRTFKSN